MSAQTVTSKKQLEKYFDFSLFPLHCFILTAAYQLLCILVLQIFCLGRHDHAYTVFSIQVIISLERQYSNTAGDL